MKKILLIVSLIIVCASVYAQQVNIDNRLLAKYHQEYLESILQSSPQEIEYLNWMLDNSFVIKNLDEKSAAKYPKLRYFDKETKLVGCEASIYNPETFNIMEYYFEIDYEVSSIYVIGNTTKAVVFYSGKKLTEKFNNLIQNRNESK